MAVIHIHSEEEWNKKLSDTKGFSAKPMIVDFTASWCGPCKMIAPFFEELSTKYPSVMFVKVDVDEVQEVAASCSVRAMPTFHGYYNGEKVDELVGADKTKLEGLIKTLSQKSAASMGPGQKLGGAAAPSAGEDTPEARRARALAAAEARAAGH